ncbi:hypothetical protein M9H77_04190 [Catharanthus roseus]|uniref:Uncharacterized protein n=1 Tax=Catharanthus roseus TaxID=4058 RepID=A0ACC0CDN7_CATRO|nr:hypothetical protein M9H77_04190 [Catharanthus roseus]
MARICKKKDSPPPDTVGVTTSDTAGSTDSKTAGSIDSGTRGSTDTYYILLHEPLPISQLSCRSGSSGLTIVGLRSCQMSSDMRMGPDITHHQDEACKGDQGQRPDKRFAWGSSSREKEARLDFGDVLGADDEQADLTERFSKSKHLEELHKHQKENKKGQYSKFHEARQRPEEKAAAMGAAMPDELLLMATIAGGLNPNWLFGAGSEAVHLKAESSRTTVGLPPCYLDAELRIMRRVEAAVSNVCAAFDKHMKRFAE